MTAKNKKIIIVLAVVAAVLTASISWIAWGNRALTVSVYTVTDSRIPAGFSGFRIAQISDLHNSEFGENNEKLLSMLRSTEPDIILITGDLVDSRNTDIAIATAFATGAAEIAPTYYVTGNHEARISEYAKLKTELEAAGIAVLEDERVEVGRNGDVISLLGVNDPSFLTDNPEDSGAATEKALTRLMNEDDAYTVLAAHRPELLSAYAKCGVNLVFSGHAHGGQFRLPFVGGLFAPGQGLLPEYDAGLFCVGNTKMIVSRGIGNSIFPFRINNRPEIVLAELNPSK